MPQLLSLSRAARLADVTRGELQKRLRKDRIQTFEGEIAVDDLLKLYPHIDLEEDPVLERVQRIKSEARPKSHYTDGWMPDPQVLMKRLHEFQHTLVQTKSALNNSEELLYQTVMELQDAVKKPESALRDAIHACIGRLEGARGRLDRVEDAKARLFAKDALLKIVTASVQLQPSGHEFFVEGNDSILEAGLKAGLYLDYGCTSGNCGACKCKVVSGAVRKLRQHDYVLSAKEQAEGYILACSNTAISDLVLEAHEADVNEALPHQVIRAVVRRVEREGPGLAVLHAQTPRTQSLRFKAGQWVRLSTEEGVSDQLYIASCPCDGRHLQFLLFSGIGSPLEASVFEGDLTKQTVVLEGPEGGFLLHEDSRRPVLFVAKAGGLAPVKSLVEQAITIDEAEEIGLVLVGGNPRDSSLERLCRAWGDALDNFNYLTTESDIPPSQLAEMLTQMIGSSERTEVYMAGPESWLDEVSGAAGENGLDVSGWTIERVGQ